MIARGSDVHRPWLAALAVSFLYVSTATAQVPRGGGPARSPQQGYPPSAYRMAERPATPPQQPVARQAPQHPLKPAVDWAHRGLTTLRQIDDYSAVLVKRERVEGVLGEEQYLFVKIRHRPLSVYMYFLKPDNLKGREVIFVDGQNDGKLVAHETGIRKNLFGTVQLDPTGNLAMRGQRYPITEIGILNLVTRLIEIGNRDMKYGECEVNFYKGAKVNDRVCTCIQVTHPVPRSNFLFHVARIFVDDELNLPIRYEAYDWPKKPGGAPQLIEQYTYTNLKLNNGYTDADFDHNNPNYGYPD